MLLPEERQHLSDEVGKRVLVRRARAGHEAAEEEQVAALVETRRVGLRLDDSREYEGRLARRDLADVASLLLGHDEDDVSLLDRADLRLPRLRRFHADVVPLLAGREKLGEPLEPLEG